ncbi:hypothetical protein SAMN04515617_11863 [Collimonas sp. OK242]|jgi:hypothetical protein|uniref:hypothetical protein n=1 Tax=Collimonas sp. OK242 TaxID=1798195 RepID=UPI00089869AE|nr:hypothetical protein [Collimonas sp. OK242]SDY64918.1 hypothetical protein SAMN04515617_11863 [Collimonas sp. OK242]
MTKRQLFDIACSFRGLSFAPAFTSQSLGAVYRFTQMSPDAVALCGYLAVHSRARADGLVLIAMAEPEFRQRSLQVQTMAGRALPAAVNVFVKYLINEIQSSD